MSEAYNEYLKLSAKLHVVRKQYKGKLPEKEMDALEDPILDAMDPLWWEMTQEERDRIDAAARAKIKSGE